jgi:hypothetical protein
MQRLMNFFRSGCSAVLLGAVIAAVVPVRSPRAMDVPADARTKTYDDLLDLYVRDGYVYYRALKSERARFDGYVTALGEARLDGTSRDEQIAFWINAYNAFVLQTVIDHYPITQRSRDYPAKSIRQIPGAFERLPHRAAGRTVTLDEIEQQVLPPFRDPRVFLALGRGAVGSGRLRSEAYRSADLEPQLAGDASECLNRSQCVSPDIAGNKLRVSSIFSWREQDFAAAYGDKAAPTFSSRTPIERAVLAFVDPKLLTTERDFLAKNAFKLEYIPFDWTLNDLTGR